MSEDIQERLAIAYENFPEIQENPKALFCDAHNALIDARSEVQAAIEKERKECTERCRAAYQACTTEHYGFSYTEQQIVKAGLKE